MTAPVADQHPDNALVNLPRTASEPLNAQHNITLQNLSYTYIKTAKLPLMNLNIEIPVGSAVGLVGSTGSGKTTLVDVLLGLLCTTQGAKIVDDVPGSDAQLRPLRQSVGYVPQENF